MSRRPSIKILCYENIKIDEIQEIFYGIEEEGLYHYVNFVSKDLLKKENYTDGILEVGICINEKKEVILATRKYDKEYIQKYDLKNSSLENLRKIGSNSARLVKGLPLRF